VTVAVKSSAKPIVVEDSPEVKALKARVAQLEAEQAVKATKQPKAARAESAFTSEDVLGLDQEFWYNLSQEMFVRNSDGSFKPTVTKTGGTRVTMKAGLDYGVYRFIKGIARQMGSKTFEELSEAQVGALRNILSYCAAHDLIESPEVVVAPVKKSRRSKKA
jgi:hypothetical protein